MDPKQPLENDKAGLNKEDKPVNTEGSEVAHDSLKNASPGDARADEKVIVNEQREDKIVNVPSQTGVNASESRTQDEDIVNSGNL